MELDSIDRLRLVLVLPQKSSLHRNVWGAGGGWEHTHTHTHTRRQAGKERWRVICKNETNLVDFARIGVRRIDTLERKIAGTITGMAVGDADRKRATNGESEADRTAITEESIARIDSTAAGKAVLGIETRESIVVGEENETKTFVSPHDPGRGTADPTNPPETFQADRRMEGRVITGPPIIGLVWKTTIWHPERWFTGRLPV